MKDMKEKMKLSALRKEPHYIEEPVFAVFPGP
jgi:hypothetical protein